METTVTTSNAFYQASGSSPPVEGDAALLPELIDDLPRLLADALLADIHQYPNLAALQPKLDATVESPSGFDRTQPPARPSRTRQEPAAADRHSCAGPSERRPPPRQSRGRHPKKVGRPSETPEARLLPAKKFES
jgi:hypothetical protein